MSGQSRTNKSTLKKLIASFKKQDSNFQNGDSISNDEALIVENLRSTAEILIWGDQNDSSVFDSFLEKNMLSFFLDIMKNRCSSFVCVQLLQTLNILFENIRKETSLYYLLSNNHVNSIIVHKFDFNDEEIMAYYISFLKTLSFKLNPNTIHFFFSTDHFPLYTEAIKFFSHSEKMVRIAVRTITLNVFRVDEKSMLKFITDRTAVPFFSNLVWIIHEHVINIDKCLKSGPLDDQQMIKLDDLFAELLDHLHYMSDILMLKINDLNTILVDHLMQRLFIPLVESYEDDPNSSMLKLYTLEFATDAVNRATSDSQPLMSEQHIMMVEQLKESAESDLREIFRTKDLELFEHEYQNVRRRRLDIDCLSKCQSPSDGNEGRRYCIRMYLMWRKFLCNIRREKENIDDAIFNVRMAVCASTLQQLMSQYVRGRGKPQR